MAMRSEHRLITVIIPCYNQAHFLSEAIESILNQTYQNFELIVVDDGSTDDTSKVAASYERVKLIQQKNQGQAAARNTGLHASKGDYLVFLDSDDRLLPHALEIGVSALETYPDCAFVWGHCQHIGPDGEPVPYKRKPLIERDYYLIMLHNNYIRTPSSVMYRRSAFEAVGDFDVTLLRGVEDYDLHLRIARKFPIHCHDEIVAEYRVHGSSTSHNSARMLKGIFAVLYSQWDYVKGNREYEESYRKGIRSWQNLFGERLINDVQAHLRSRRELGQALKGIWVLLRFYPRGVAGYALRKFQSTVLGIKV